MHGETELFLCEFLGIHRGEICHFYKSLAPTSKFCVLER